MLNLNYHTYYYYCYYYCCCHFDCTVKSGTFGIPGLVLPGRGTAWLKSGTGGNPKLKW